MTKSAPLTKQPSERTTSADRRAAHRRQSLPNSSGSSPARWLSGAQNGDANAAHQLAIYYCTAGDVALAGRWLLRAARAGHRAAQFSLAQACESGLGVPRDAKKAAGWCTPSPFADPTLATHIAPRRRRYEKAAEQGDGEACLRLAMQLEKGVGVGADVSAAERWYEKAAEHGIAAATYRLQALRNKGAPADVRTEHKAATAADTPQKRTPPASSQRRPVTPRSGSKRGGDAHLSRAATPLCSPQTEARKAMAMYQANLKPRWHVKRLLHDPSAITPTHAITRSRGVCMAWHGMAWH